MPANSPPIPVREPLKRSTLWILASVTALLTLNWLAAVARFQVNVPIWDQWDFFNPLFNEEGLFGLFNYQHGPHRQGLAFLFSSWVMSASHWDSRVESLWMVALLVSATCLALRLKKKITGHLEPLDACIPLLILTLGQWGSVISVPNASHSVFPLLLVILSACCWLELKDSIRLHVSGALAALSIFTGFGIFNGVVLTALLAGTLLRGAIGRRKIELSWGTLGFAISVIGWVSFLHGYRPNAASEGYHFPHTPISDYARFLALMLAHPAGSSQATAFAEIAGGALLALCASVFLITGYRGYHNNTTARSDETVLLLLGSGLAFAAFTAVGRIHLGLSAGMASRYVTLLIPLWLGLYFWGAVQTSRVLKFGTALIVLSVAMSPFAYLLQRPVSSWLGTAGLSHASLAELTDSTSQKMAWVSAYLQTRDSQLADQKVGRFIHPAAEGIGLSSKLAWLQARRLSLFSSSSPDAWQPWWPEPRCLWLHTHDPEFNERWMADDGALWIHSDRSGFVNFRVVQKAPALPSTSSLEFTYRQIRGSERADFLTETISLPIVKGEQTILLHSAFGSVPADPPRDKRRISFRVGEATITDKPEGVEWASTSGLHDAVWAPAFCWRFKAGFHGWERPARFGWGTARVEIEILPEHPVFLNIRIEKRYRPVASGPVFVDFGGARIEIHSPDKSPEFSLAVPRSDSSVLVAVENTAGAASPRDKEGKPDTRELALKFGEISVSRAPKFPLLSP